MQDLDLDDWRKHDTTPDAYLLTFRETAPGYRRTVMFASLDSVLHFNDKDVVRDYLTCVPLYELDHPKIQQLIELEVAKRLNMITRKCNCDCHYVPGIKHIMPCCARCYQLYDPSEWEASKVESSKAIVRKGISFVKTMNWPEDIKAKERRCLKHTLKS
jgi:hypothetical protein